MIQGTTISITMHLATLRKGIVLGDITTWETVLISIPNLLSIRLIRQRASCIRPVPAGKKLETGKCMIGPAFRATPRDQGDLVCQNRLDITQKRVYRCIICIRAIHWQMQHSQNFSPDLPRSANECFGPEILTFSITSWHMTEALSSISIPVN